MKERPRKASAGIITPQLARQIFGVGGLFLLLLFALHYILEHLDLTTGQWAEGKEQLTALDLSVFFTTFVFLQLWNMFNAKAFHSGHSAFAGMDRARYFLLIAAVILVGQFLITTFAYDFFQIAPLPFSYWIALLIATSPVLWIGELGASHRPPHWTASCISQQIAVPTPMICSSLHRPLCTLLLGIGLLASSCQQGEQRSTRLQIATTIAPAAQVITEIADSLVR